MQYQKKLRIGVLAGLLLLLWCVCRTESAPAPTPPPTPTPFAVNFAAPQNEENLLLVNPWNPIPEDYGVTLRQLENGQTVSELCYDALMQMLSDCAAAGYKAEVCSGYRNIALQTQLYEDKVSRVMQEGQSHREAERIAAMEVAGPGTSEHHTGLAVDLVDAEYGTLDETQAQMPAQQWLMVNCSRYGFILRYPEGKSEITGIIYEPWHYRYVGVEAAERIYAEGLCLEEYLNQYQ